MISGILVLSGVNKPANLPYLGRGIKSSLEGKKQSKCFFPQIVDFSQTNIPKFREKSHKLYIYFNQPSRGRKSIPNIQHKLFISPEFTSLKWRKHALNIYPYFLNSEGRKLSLNFHPEYLILHKFTLSKSGKRKSQALYLTNLPSKIIDLY